MQRFSRFALVWAVLASVSVAAGSATAAPYAAMVIDARSGEVLHSRNADTKLHPASLTKMMTLYVVFDAVARGEISLDTPVRVSRFASREPASKLYLREGQRVKLRYLIRASAVKSANDAATAMAEAISGSEAAFADRMTRTARALGMNDTTFKNAHGLTQAGHMSTARDMTTLGRALFFHFPEYYNLFSRKSANAAGKTVHNTNRRLLAAYKGADGIKTGYTRAAGFNLVASAERGQERVIATVFGGNSGASRNARVAELLDMGFQRAPTRVALRRPAKPDLTQIAAARPQGTTRSAQLAVQQSARPQPRPVRVDTLIAAVTETVTEKLDNATAGQTASTAGLTDALVAEALIQVPDDLPAGLAAPQAIARTEEDDTRPGEIAPQQVASASAFATPVSPAPPPRPAVITFSSKGSGDAIPAPAAEPETVVVVAQVSTSDGQLWGINVGTYASRYEAERILLRTALIEIDTLDTALRQVVRKQTGFAAEFTGLDERSAALACKRLSARQQSCETLRP